MHDLLTLFAVFTVLNAALFFGAYYQRWKAEKPKTKPFNDKIMEVVKPTPDQLGQDAPVIVAKLRNPARQPSLHAVTGEARNQYLFDEKCEEGDERQMARKKLAPGDFKDPDDLSDHDIDYHKLARESPSSLDHKAIALLTRRISELEQRSSAVNLATQNREVRTMEMLTQLQAQLGKMSLEARPTSFERLLADNDTLFKPAPNTNVDKDVPRYPDDGDEEVEEAPRRRPGPGVRDRVPGPNLSSRAQRNAALAEAVERLREERVTREQAEQAPADVAWDARSRNTWEHSGTDGDPQGES